MDNYEDDRAQDQIREFEIYDLDSDSWKVVDLTPECEVEFNHRGLSLKGNTYWFAQEKIALGPGRGMSDMAGFLICFDFTRERFGPRLPLPFHSSNGDNVTLSSVRDEQLAVLFQSYGASSVKIWISSKIEPNAVLWRKLFLAVDMKLLPDF
ncbi:F-box associated interaction domain [Arabidopsis suecica]|uniref:F-box associated interaction domain n=1 Tax=Arabidopsis suecica TaxID=45249 RepID=A0A8T2B8C6_ARASU|nr:F-box associated interaction domain [Arabidopsis suecica]